MSSAINHYLKIIVWVTARLKFFMLLLKAIPMSSFGALVKEISEEKEWRSCRRQKRGKRFERMHLMG